MIDIGTNAHDSGLIVLAEQAHVRDSCVVGVGGFEGREGEGG